MNILQFMSDSPILTFFLALIVVQGITQSIAYMKNSGRCVDCKAKFEED